MAKKQTTKKRTSAKTHPVASAVAKLIGVVRRYESPSKTDCIPVGFTIRFDRVSDRRANCAILKLYCCKCDPGVPCTECDMKNGTTGKLVNMPIIEVKVPDAASLLKPIAKAKSAGTGQSGKKSPTKKRRK